MSFTYDGDGNRISKDSTYFVNDVNLPLTQVLLEQDGAGNTLASYTYGLELISMTKGANTYYYIYDGLGSVVAVTDEAGQTIQTYDYDAFGNVIATSGTLENPYQFIGAYGCANDGVGLIYMRARYYAPSIGRFISRDPIWGRINDPLSLNRYTYVQNNPVIYVDPYGLLIFSGHLSPYLIAPPLSSFPPTSPPAPGLGTEGIPIWGNWCGPGHGGGDPQGVCVDAACKKHDECYGKHCITGVTWLFDPARKNCDRQLCFRLAFLCFPSNPQEKDAKKLIMSVMCPLGFWPR